MDQWNTIESPEIDTPLHSQLILNKQFNEGKAPLINKLCFSKTGVHIGKINLETRIKTYTKISLRIDHRTKFKS